MNQEIERRVLAKKWRYIMPVVWVVYVLAFIDRVNIGVASLTGFIAYVRGGGICRGDFLHRILHPGNTWHLYSGEVECQEVYRAYIDFVGALSLLLRGLYKIRANYI